MRRLLLGLAWAIGLGTMGAPQPAHTQSSATLGGGSPSGGQCLRLLPDGTGFENTCPVSVHYAYCAARAVIPAGSNGLYACEEGGYSATTIEAAGTVLNRPGNPYNGARLDRSRNTNFPTGPGVYWYECAYPRPGQYPGVEYRGVAENTRYNAAQRRWVGSCTNYNKSGIMPGSSTGLAASSGAGAMVGGGRPSPQPAPPASSSPPQGAGNAGYSVGGPATPFPPGAAGPLMQACRSELLTTANFMSTPQKWPQDWAGTYVRHATNFANSESVPYLRSEYKRLIFNGLSFQMLRGIECMLDLRVRQLGGSVADLRAAVAPPGMGGSGTVASTSTPSTTTPSAPNEAQRQMWELCDSSIKSRQADTKRQIAAGGDIDKLSRSLGEYQRALFTRQCYDHPQAKDYIASADRMIAGASGGGTAGGAGPSPTASASRSSPSTAAGGSDLKPLQDSKTPVNNCLGPKTVNGRFGIANSCDYPIEYTFCVLKPRADSWSSSYNCEKQSFGATGIAAKGWNSGLGGGIQVYWFACRKPSLPGKKSFEPGKGIVSRCF